MQTVLRFSLVVVVLCHIPVSIFGQFQRVQWQRVYTGDDSIIEIDLSSLKFEPENILRATFRTVLSKSESLGPSTATKYKSRVETVLFKSAGGAYRFDEVKWLDSNGSVVHHSLGSVVDWRVLKHGGIMEKLFASMSALSPLGSWKVVDYRFADGPTKEAVDSQELSRLIGERVRFDLRQAQVGVKVCLLPSYQSRRISSQEFLGEIGVDPGSIGLKSEYVETTVIKCKGAGWAPPQSMLIVLPGDKFLMLWEGVFLVLDKRRD